MHRYVSPIVDADVGTFAAELDPTAPGRGHHVNFDMVLRRCGHAWIDFLRAAGVVTTGVIVPRIEVDYLREMGVGDLVIDVRVLSIGRSSFRLGLDVHQHDALAARAEVVLVVFDYGTKAAVPLSGAQRATLEPHLS